MQLPMPQSPVILPVSAVNADDAGERRSYARVIVLRSIDQNKGQLSALHVNDHLMIGFDR